MKKISRRSFLQACGVAAAMAALTACGGSKIETGKTADAHEAITFMAPYKEVEAFIEQVHSVYPEVNVEIVPYSGDNTTTCLQNMFAAGDLPDVCTLTYYDPRIDLVSDKLLDLSGYDFTDNYVESRLQDVFDNGAIYLLPSTYNCYGITYNKTLLREHGWELPNSFTELEELAAKAKEAGVDLCLTQIQYPGYGFQYLCNIADADFLGTLDGRLWQRDYLSGKANVSNTPGMMQAMAYVQKWKDIGMLNDSGDALDDNVTWQRMVEGNTLFLIGNTNGIVEADGNADKFGLMPFLSEDGTQNVFVLNVNRFYGLNKKLEQDPQKLEDALKVMRVLSTVAGTSALQPATALKSSLLPFKDAKADDTYYADIADALNAGNTAPFIYSGWENTIVTTGLKMLDFIKRKEFNVGLNGALLNNRLTFAVNYYNTVTDGLLAQPDYIYPSYMHTYWPVSTFVPNINYGKNRRTGVDFSLGYKDKVGDFEYGIQAFGQTNSSKNLKVAENVEYDYMRTEGRLIDALWGYECLGYYNSQEEIDNAEAKSSFGTVKPGDLKYKDQNGDGIIDSKDRVVIGRWSAKFTGGMNLTLKYKNFTLFAMLTGQFGGNAIKNDTYNWVYGERKYSDVVLGAWTEDKYKNGEAITYPRLTTQSGDNNFNTSDYWMYSTDRIDLSRVQLTYDFSKSLFGDNALVKGLQVYVNGSSLLTIAGERKQMERNVGSAPQTRSFTIGAKVEF